MNVREEDAVRVRVRRRHVIGCGQTWRKQWRRSWLSGCRTWHCDLCCCCCCCSWNINICHQCVWIICTFCCLPNYLCICHFANAGKYTNCVTLGLITCCEPHKKKIHQGFYFVLLSLCFSTKLHKPRKRLYFLHQKIITIKKQSSWAVMLVLGWKNKKMNTGIVIAVLWISCFNSTVIKENAELKMSPDTRKDNIV